MFTDFLRDQAFAIAWLGLMASAWFGWSQEDPKPSLRAWLGAGSVLGMLTAGASACWCGGTGPPRPRSRASTGCSERWSCSRSSSSAAAASGSRSGEWCASYFSRQGHHQRSRNSGPAPVPIRQIPNRPSTPQHLPKSATLLRAPKAVAGVSHTVPTTSRRSAIAQGRLVAARGLHWPNALGTVRAPDPSSSAAGSGF